MAEQPYEPYTVPAVDYELTLNSGVQRDFTLRPDLGDTEHLEGDSKTGVLHIYLASSKHHVDIKMREVAICGRREYERLIIPPGYVPPPEEPKPAKAKPKQGMTNA